MGGQILGLGGTRPQTTPGFVQIPGLLQVSPNNSKHVFFDFVFFTFLLIRKYPTFTTQARSERAAAEDRFFLKFLFWVGGVYMCVSLCMMKEERRR